MTSLKQPPFLKPGQRIGIVSTARKISPEELQPALNIIQSWGFEAVPGKNLFKVQDQFAGSDEERAADLQQMMDDPEIHAILCARGGYGSIRLLDRLDFKQFRDHPKWIAGYSDVTAIHAHLQNVLGIQSLHATMPISFPENTPESVDSLRMALMGELESYAFQAERNSGPVHMQGVLSGGNLSMLYSMTGTKELKYEKGRILFLEDLDEYLYHIDRMMMNLKRSGLFDGLSGVLVGDMTDMNDNTVPFGKTPYEIIDEHTHDLPFPVIFGFPAGHGKDNRAIYLGRNCEVSGNEIQYNLRFC
jgi:muramoyltetrapeptide carboxypeptidase